MNPPPPLDDIAAQVLARLGAQRDLPRVAIADGWRIGNWSLNLPDVLLAVALTLCTALVAYSLFRLRRVTGGAWDARPGAAAAPGDDPLAHLSRAEHFAAGGCFMEAMHELLLQCLADIRRRSAGRLDASLTSREILATATLAAAERDALAGIIARVEHTYFGRRPADATLWQECRARFLRLHGDAPLRA